MGREHHPEKPYSDPRCVVVNDDARNYFATSNEQFDVISFGLLDSHTTTALTNARLDHYVYTRESILQAKSLLKENGIIALTFDAQRPFIIDRIHRVLREVFNQSPIVFYIPHNAYGWGGVMFITGDLDTVQRQLQENNGLAEYIEQRQQDYQIQLSDNT